jgi:hypothetical protein
MILNIILIWGMTAANILETIVLDRTLFVERNFVPRVEAVELLEAELAFAVGTPADPGLEQAARLKTALEEIDDRLFERLRAEIAAGHHRGNAFRELLLAYCGTIVTEGPEYDTLDIFVNRLCSYLPMPSPVQTLEPEMVDYHKTPVRIALELARWVGPSAIFVDLGAGLGQVVLLVHLLTGAAGRGLEIEPAFCEYARDCAAGLGLSPGERPGEAGAPPAVSFIEGDARYARYDEGTVFFMYTPFTGALLDIVFGILQREALSRSFVVIAYGPIIKHAARQSWLRAVESSDTLCVFRAG